jgi:predicted RNase H-like HicB family nuclease
LFTARINYRYQYNPKNDIFILERNDACSAFGETPDEALHEVQKARDLWIAAARAEGKTIPLPKYRPVIYQAISA